MVYFMKKFAVLAVITVFFSLSCLEPFINEWPKTDVEKFIDRNTNTVTFPRHTPVWDIYYVIDSLHQHTGPGFFDVLNGVIIYDESVEEFTRIRYSHTVNSSGVTNTMVFFYYHAWIERIFNFIWAERRPNQAAASAMVTDVEISFQF